jgi:hypothetical protein
MADYRAIRYVAEHYVHLQGLRLVPVGVPFVVSAAWRAGWLGWWPATQGRGAAGWFWGLFAAGVGCSFIVRRWYEREFGRAAPRPTQNGAVSFGLFAGGLALTIWCQLASDPPVSLPLLFVAALLATFARQGLYVRPHYVLIALGSTIVATLRLLGVPVGVRGVALDALIGVGLIVAGIADHHVLRQACADARGDVDG